MINGTGQLNFIIFFNSLKQFVIVNLYVKLHGAKIIYAIKLFNNIF